MALESQKLVAVSIVLKTGFNVRAMFAQSYFALPILHNILHHFLLGNFIILSVCIFCKDV